MEQKRIEVKTPKISNRIELDNRSNILISGVIETISATESQILLKTDFGPLTINGSSLHIQSLNKNDKTIEADGEINEIKYTKTKKSFLQRLFK